MLYKEAIDQGTLELLIELHNCPELKDFALVGGTALALQRGHRKSVDLDFFTLKEFDTSHILQVLENRYIVSLSGRGESSLNCVVNDIKVDLIRHAYPLLEDLIVEDGFTLWSLEDIAAAKVLAITNRGAKKDFFDLVELLRDRTLDSILSAFAKKYPSSERFMALKALTWFDDAEEEPDPITLKALSWEQIKQSLIKVVQDYTE